ncbi:SNF2-related protein [Asticcacaulis sp.]|uniref:SNF2-related protein n=1 Tax=Asticcacaulis sp. TaxID=1872648 RepID=UPI002C61293B|nr:SNF2-related protein [Asticcacaulis sp.]HTM81942.1 SNF2-related protein [Asticcacaulis sp.]
MDTYLRFINGVQALRRRTAAINVALGGALGVAADPLPFQMSTVRRVLGDTQIRHLLSDEVGLGKTVQALMIVNALRWQNRGHRTLVVTPDNLLSQWQEECWIRGHVMPAVAGGLSPEDGDLSPVTLAQARDLATRPGQERRTIEADSRAFDLLIIDEPQTMPREIVAYLAQAADTFREVLVLSATPRLGDPAWRELLLRIIEPELSERARHEARSIDELLEEREALAVSETTDFDDPAIRARAFMRAASSRRVIRNSRTDWSAFLPERRNHEIRILPLKSERLRYEIAATLLANSDPAQGMQGSAWTAARALQRSARAARTVLRELSGLGGALGERAEEALQLSLTDPGDSRLEALLDILSEQWAKSPDRAFIVVCGDNPTIDMLQSALPRYFPELSGAISALRRTASADNESVTNLKEIQETLAPLLAGKNRLLLVGDWVQAGLNLHYVSRGIIFFSLPWEIDSIDQLIGRVDRLGKAGAPVKSSLLVDIWRLLPDGSQEAAIADHAAALGVFDAPLPPMSPDELRAIQEALGRTAMKGRVSGTVTPITGQGTGLTSRLTAHTPFSPDNSRTEFNTWKSAGSPAPLIVNEAPRENDTPLRNEERALGSWLKTIAASTDFDIGQRNDRTDDYSFRTLWYHGTGDRGRAGVSPFLIPGASHDGWMGGHIPFIYRRTDLSARPRKGVFTDDGERAVAGEKSARPLRFLDHGCEVHDAIVTGYTTDLGISFPENLPIEQSVVRLPEGHPASGLGRVLITVAAFDPFPDHFIPPLWSEDAKEIFNKATSDAQRHVLESDRHQLLALWRAFQRRIRIEVPAQTIRIGACHTENGWRDMTQDETDTCLRPLAGEKNSAVARGRSPSQPVLKPEQIAAIRTGHRNKIRVLAGEYITDCSRRAFSAADMHSTQLFNHFQSVNKNRELALERRESMPVNAGPVEFRHGQIAVLERQLAMSQQNAKEAIALVQKYAAGRMSEVQPTIFSILLALTDDH